MDRSSWRLPSGSSELGSQRVSSVPSRDVEHAAAYQLSRSGLSNRERPFGSAVEPLGLPVPDPGCDVSPREVAWLARPAHVVVVLAGPHGVDVGVSEAIQHYDTVGERHIVRLPRS